MQIDDRSRLALIRHALKEIEGSTDPRAPAARQALLRQMAEVSARMRENPVDQVVQLQPLRMRSQLRGA